MFASAPSLSGGPAEAPEESTQSFWADYPAVHGDLRRVNSVISDSLNQAPVSLRGALEELASRPGKQLRPAFTLLAARSKWSGRDTLQRELPDKIYRIAAAVELLHLATLIHDDVIDRSDRRRGMPTLHTLYGSRKAILMGDYLFSRCFTLVAGDASMENARLLASGVSRMCEAQIAEGEEGMASGGSVRSYLRRVVGKTALLFALSMHVGSSENGLPLKRRSVLRRAGYNIGIAFQITDDVLDVTGTPEQLGKPAGVDVSQGVASLPLVIAQKRGGERFRRVLSDALRGRIDAAALHAAIEESGAIKAARGYADRYSGRALQELSQLPAAAPRTVLEEVTQLLLARSW